jgi:hypothetical protein
MSNPIEELMKKGDAPGVSIRNANVVNPQHPGYIGAIPEGQLPRNLFQEQYDASMHDFGIDYEMLFDIASGSGAPMAIGSVAKTGKGLLQNYLKKAFSKTPGVKSSKDVFEAGRFDILGDAYTGGRFTPGMSKTGSVPGGKTVKRTGVDPIQSPSGIENYYRNLVLETGGKDGLKNFDNMINSRMDWIKRNWDSHKVDMRYNRPADESFPKVGTKRYLEIRNKLAKEIAWDM